MIRSGRLGRSKGDCRKGITKWINIKKFHKYNCALEEKLKWNYSCISTTSISMFLEHKIPSSLYKKTIWKGVAVVAVVVVVQKKNAYIDMCVCVYKHICIYVCVCVNMKGSPPSRYKMVFDPPETLSERALHLPLHSIGLVTHNSLLPLHFCIIKAPTSRPETRRRWWWRGGGGRGRRDSALVSLHLHFLIIIIIVVVLRGWSWRITSSMRSTVTSETFHACWRTTNLLASFSCWVRSKILHKDWIFFVSFFWIGERGKVLILGLLCGVDCVFIVCLKWRPAVNNLNYNVFSFSLLINDVFEWVKWRKENGSENRRERKLEREIRRNDEIRFL